MPKNNLVLKKWVLIKIPTPFNKINKSLNLN